MTREPVTVGRAGFLGCLVVVLGVLLLAGLLSACGDDGAAARVAIELDVPVDDRGGALLADLDSLDFRVSDGGQFVATQLYQVERGLPVDLRLPSVPTGSQILFDLSGISRSLPVAYGRTCRLVVNPDDETISARLYFSRIGRFRTGQPPLQPARESAVMFSDDQGRAFVTGGSADRVVELFDPRVGEFRAVGEAEGRVGGAIAVRANGTAVVAGGIEPDGGAPLAAVEVINPASPDDRFIERLEPDSPEAARTGLTLVALPDRSVLLAGGRTADGAVTDGLALLNDGDDEFRASGLMAQPRTGHTASIGLGDVVYLIGGITSDVDTGESATGSIELYRPQDQTIRTPTATLGVPRFGHTATALGDGRILVVGGKSPRAAPCDGDSTVDPETCFEAVSAVEVFDPIIGQVRSIDPGIPGGIYDHTATLVAGGRVLIAGGFDGDDVPSDRAWLFDPQVEALVPTRELSRGRARHTATELCDGTVLLVGGDSSDGQPLSSERYVPASDRPP